ncbi:MAG: phosphate signaling complex protein PhoU [Erysipelotrichaceae bacterium]|jgi:phosphate transport system protein
MRNRFDQELEELENSMTRMGAMCEQSISLCIDALFSGNRKTAGEVIVNVSAISREEREIEAICLKLLMQQQPVATDLRVISSALKMVGDMERVGDQAGDIAEIVLTENLSAANDILNLKKMADASSEMVTGAISAFTERNADKAHAVIQEDDVVDEAFNAAKQKLIEIYDKRAANMEYAVDLIMIAKYFERIGDHATNIAQWALYAITGVREGNTN